MNFDTDDMDVDDPDKKKGHQNHYRSEEERDDEAKFTWNVLSGIGVVVMAIVCFDLWFIVKENPDKITPYYLQLTKEQIKKAEEESERKADRRSKRAKQKEEDMK